MVGFRGALSMANNLGISLHGSKINAEREMGRAVKALGFEERRIGPHVINIFFYSCEYLGEPGVYYRADFYINGRKTNGIAFD